MSEEIKGYKVFNEDWTCRGKQYTCPGEFEEDVKLNLCESGMHFCTHLLDCFRYYPLNPIYHVAEVVSYGDVCTENDQIKVAAADTKMCTNKLKVVKEFSFEEVMDILKKDYTSSCIKEDYTSLCIKENFEKTKLNKENIITFIHLLNDKIRQFNATCADLNNRLIIVDLRPESNQINFYIYLYLKKPFNSTFNKSCLTCVDALNLRMDDLYNSFESKENTIEDVLKDYVYKIWRQYQYDEEKNNIFLN